jgi:hypothetical protein
VRARQDQGPSANASRAEKCGRDRCQRRLHQPRLHRHPRSRRGGRGFHGRHRARGAHRLESARAARHDDDLSHHDHGITAADHGHAVGLPRGETHLAVGTRVAHRRSPRLRAVFRRGQGRLPFARRPPLAQSRRIRHVVPRRPRAHRHLRRRAAWERRSFTKPPANTAASSPAVTRTRTGRRCSVPSRPACVTSITSGAP